MAKLFIGVPVYNGERFLREALESLCEQTFTDWKIFISDDASTDGTAAICNDFTKKDSRISYFKQEKNIGMFPNFKFLIDKADCEYFMWAGQDDVWEKEYVKTCISNLEKNKDIGLATSILGVIDSYGRIVKEEPLLASLAGRPSYLSVARFVMQPEIMGKCNIMYSIFRTDAIKKVWQIYPQKKEWGSDYHFSLAAISHFGLIVEPKILYKKRLGGYSNPNSTKNDSPLYIQKIEVGNPKNHTFPFGRFRNYRNNHMKALENTPYRPLAAIILYFRLPRIFFIYLKEKILKKLSIYITSKKI